MSWNDAFNYLAYNNPVTKTTIAGVSGLAKIAGIRPKSTSSATQTVSRSLSSGSQQLLQPLWNQTGTSSIFIRLAALSGASAVCFAAYGRHRLKDTPESKEFRNIYESANHMHMLHSVVLLAIPLVKRPAISGTLFVMGTVLFSGTCYYKAIRKARGEADSDKNQQTLNLAPIGGVCLILGWLSLLF